jgi:type VI secretion system protein ImpI
MGLILTIENEASLPNDAPVSVSLGPGGGLDIGRSANQDWSLPDPSRFISGKHCEVRYRDGFFWLYDISANGTFLNASASRMQAPHRLADGDRIAVGAYIIAVTIEADVARAEPPEAVAQAPIGDTVPAGADPWMPAPEPREDGEMRGHEELSLREAAKSPRPHENSGPDPVAPGTGGEEFLRRFAVGAGVPEQVFARWDSLQLAEELGALLRLTTENLTQLLRARSDIGRTAGVSSQTTVQALDNNPLKFTPSADDALRIMFGPKTRGFLDARCAFEGAFTDLKAHQLYTFAAMQQAIGMLVEDFDPKAIDAAVGSDRGLADLFLSRKARLWDLYVARWQAQTLRQDDGLVGAFMRYFGQCFGDAKDANMH